MSEQHDADEAKEPIKELKAEESSQPELATKDSAPSVMEKTEGTENRLLPVPAKAESTDLSTQQQFKPEEAKVPAAPGTSETEWIPGEQLELIRIPPPTIWPATLALGTTGIAFGVVTHWILSLAGLFLFLLGAAGWIEDMRKDVLQ